MTTDKLLDLLWFDADARDVRLRAVVTDRLRERPAPQADDHLVATYFLALRTTTLAHAAKEIAYHATSGVKYPPPGSLLEQCTARAAGVDEFDAGGRIGLLHVAFPLKMLRQPDGHLTSVDMLHTLAGAIIFDVYENQDARLVAVQIPEHVLRTFPGPAYGPYGVRELTGFAAMEPAFGTILKPTAGITPDEVGTLVTEAAACPLFLFVKEDEDLYPNLDYSPVRERTRRAAAAIERARAQRQGRGLIFAAHVTGSPHELLDTVWAAIEAGATGLMFSESFAGGTVRMVRKATRHLPRPPALYGHNAGIGVKTRGGIWREVIDLLARLDGIDFRQTAPVRPGPPFIRPYGAEWEASEEILSRPLPGIKPTMIARAGGLDQGNIIPNLVDAERRGRSANILFLAGSAINSVKNAQGQPDPRLGTEAMLQALEVHRSGELADVPLDRHVAALADLARRKRLTSLVEALRQRYPELERVMKIVEKPWGREIWVAHTDKYAFKIIEIKKGTRSSLQYHVQKHEHLYVDAGLLQMEWENDQGQMETLTLKPGEVIENKPGRKHRAIAVEDVRLLEVSTPELDDVVRVQDDYNR